MKQFFFHEVPNQSLQFPLLIQQLLLILNQLEEMEYDGLIEIKEYKISITEKGKPFVRNVCMAFDLHLMRKAPETKLFSMTI